ncbi:RNA pseudouridine synthase [bacterium CG_4_9_14_3_um_filter_65_15]|nr:MAG: RNA pseudouridine synthase [bacterium CG_4_9_14_3_um_filter_65_15]
MDAVQILHEDNHLLVVAKPAGLLVQGDASGDETLLDAGRAYLREKYAKPGNVYLGLVHRLDRNVSGVVVLARTSKAAGRLSAQFRRGEVAKTYLAVVTGSPPDGNRELRAYLAAKGDQRGVTRAAEAPFTGAKEALLHYEVRARQHGHALLEVRPGTGRRHQIRAQLALAGWPLLGDVKYGARERLPESRIALHAWKIAFAHPVGGQAVEIVCEPPVDWPWAILDI